MKISIIIPAYNCEKYIATCIDSCGNQGFAPNEYEVIVVDDGSKDRTGKILDQIVESRNIKVIHQNNQGVSATRNNGLKAACGDYVIFVDGDDVLVRNSLPHLLNLAITHNLDIAKGSLTKRNDKEILEGDFQAANPSTERLTCINGEEAMLQVFDPMKGWSVVNMFRRQFLIDNHLYYPEGISFTEDLAFTIKTYMHAQRFMEIPMVFYIYRQNETSCMATMNVKKLKSAIDVIRLVKEEMKATKGDIKRKLTETIFASTSVVLWYISHHKSLFPKRKIITDELRKTLNKGIKCYNYKELMILLSVRLCPNFYVWSRYIFARKKYA